MSEREKYIARGFLAFGFICGILVGIGFVVIFFSAQAIIGA
jgi:hypothetical protein